MAQLQRGDKIEALLRGSIRLQRGTFLQTVKDGYVEILVRDRVRTVRADHVHPIALPAPLKRYEDLVGGDE